ncbi:ribosome small subunit-dependent GTPase A [Schlesneria paludicola]|uniref:ribosome small subunit-dependent GTPase A n=1 Tax=Schlesneria paludicola TaxID=360056 RepID=UPI00029B1951|nr:ribosome small subunit-dependent GTPase A [Schlesneria paludicola]
MAHSDESGIEHLERGQRVSGKGDLSRRRTVLGETGDDNSIILHVDEAACLRGRVLAAIGSTQCTVQVDPGQAHAGLHFECTVRRVVRTVARDARNAVVTGDCVLFLPDENCKGVIERVEPRDGVLARGHQYKQHILVANVTQVAIVASAAEPALKPALIDRFLVSSAKGNVRALIILNKVDLADLADLQPVIGLYARLGYTIVPTSVQTGLGIATLKRLLQGEQTVFTGQSGVGKSSLLNAIQPGLAMKTGDVSRITQKGRHTTRFAQLRELDFGGWVVDTPGIRQLELWDVQPEEMEGYFLEFRPFVAHCKFPDCLHLVEEGCAVRVAVQNDLISQIRYESYLRLVIGDD